MLLLLLLLPTFAHAANDPNAATDWAALLNQNGGNQVYFGVALGGSSPYQSHGDEAFAPASTAKLFTAGALLAALGPNYRYPTILRWKEAAPGVAASATLIGSGDPSWGLSEFQEGMRDRLDQISAALAAQGVSAIAGELIVTAADPRWNGVQVPAGWKDSDPLGCDGALAQAFNLGLNCTELSVSGPSTAAWGQPGINYPVELAIGSGRATNLDVQFTGHSFRVFGTWHAGSRSVSFFLPVFDTRPWVAALFRASLAAHSIRFVAAIEGAGEGAAHELTFFSRPLSELLKPFLKNSINVMGDIFLKTLGSLEPLSPDATDPSLLTPGLAHLGAFLRHYGDEREFTLHDGSGLSRTSRVTPAFALSYLDRIADEAWFPALYGALSVAAVDGTLRNRMGGTAAAGVLRGKTGTLDGVYNLAGYVPSGRGTASDAAGAGRKFVPFVAFTRTGNAYAARAAEDRVGGRLAALYSEPLALTETLAPFPYVPEHAGRDASEFLETSTPPLPL